MNLIDKNKDIDIMFLSEGTYPYIKGGVSSWIHQLISGMPDLNFGIIFLGSQEKDYNGIKYELPENLVYLYVDYLFRDEKLAPKKIKYFEEEKELLYTLLEVFNGEKLTNKHDKILDFDFFNKKFPLSHFLYGKATWEYITETYTKFTSDSVFLDYFWTIRNSYFPIWRVADMAIKSKKAKLYHSVSTGYAGFIASILSYNNKKPFLLTEHGIYTKERKIDLMNADWIVEHKSTLHKNSLESSYLNDVWINLFIGLGKFAYRHSQKIFSLYGAARDMQLKYGALKNKTFVVPNGVDIDRYEPALNNRSAEIPKIITLVGRVVSIKDIKNFIMAIRIVVLDDDEVEGWIVGPTDEDEEYFKECQDLVKTFGLENNLKFLGFQNTVDIFRQSGISTITSISEGMPLVILESYASGVPVVSTNVGACRELIFGSLDDDDIKIGKAGEIVPISDPAALANKYLFLLNNKDIWKKYQKAGIKRVKKYYDQKHLLDKYQNYYIEAIREWQE